MKTLILVALVTLSFLSESVQAQDQDLRKLTALLGTNSRPAADRARDTLRKPAEVMSFLEIKEGMTVIDLIAADGYYTDVLSMTVGRNGKVYMQNPPSLLEGERGASIRAGIAKRLENNRLSNVTRLDRDFDDLGIPADSVDAAIVVLEIHEFYREASPDATLNFLQAVLTVLKPGGFLGVVDHAGNPDGNAAKLHRAVEEEVIASARAAGFRLAGTSDILRNPDDDRSKSVFDNSVRGITDRFVLKLQKPM